MIIIISVRGENGIRVYCLENIRILYDLAQKRPPWKDPMCKGFK